MFTTSAVNPHSVSSSRALRVNRYAQSPFPRPAVLPSQRLTRAAARCFPKPAIVLFLMASHVASQANAQDDVDHESGSAIAPFQAPAGDSPDVPRLPLAGPCVPNASLQVAAFVVLEFSNPDNASTAYRDLVSWLFPQNHPSSPPSQNPATIAELVLLIPNDRLETLRRELCPKLAPVLPHLQRTGAAYQSCAVELQLESLPEPECIGSANADNLDFMCLRARKVALVLDTHTVSAFCPTPWYADFPLGN